MSEASCSRSWPLGRVGTWSTCTCCRGGNWRRSDNAWWCARPRSRGRSTPRREGIHCRSCGEFHELEVGDSGEGYVELVVQRVGGVADVEEDFGEGGGFEDGFEGEGLGAVGVRGVAGAGGDECQFAQGLDVDEVDVLKGENVEL